ncbi:hypothetical protein [Streptomyces sp. NPDC012888]|uniref:hypothetical protein n=1 Tax=Streptomyces sp. NPDC012888 TaxID=3364855 RepID=UPI0036BA9183
MRTVSEYDESEADMNSTRHGTAAGDQDGAREGDRDRKESVSGNSWPIVPLGIAVLLLNLVPDATWAYATAAVLGGLGGLAALYGIAESVRAARRDRTVRGSATGVVLLLLIGLGNWIRLMF